MLKAEIHTSAEFKSQATKAIMAIVFFIITYILILMLAFGLTALCVYAGLWLIFIKPMFLTLMLGAGLASVGILILVFLLKFIVKKHKVDRTHLIEITRAEQPQLFQMIDDIVLEVGTTKPKKVYISSEVNACVFYDSSFWSMFLPVKKNLQIGLGLVNTITREELKAILSHEFGHFSQRSMKVGSYVYNVNQVIFNLLFDNESYELIIQKWSSLSGYFSLFVMMAIKIVEGIQWIFRKMYEVVNKRYMALSREMEFHADEIAASITGFEPLKNSLLRMSLADRSFENVLSYYNNKIVDNIKTENIYPNQASVVKSLANANNLPFVNFLPKITLEEQKKFDKSKLVIKDQWASHPTIEERIDRLQKTGFSNTNEKDVLANEVFTNIDELQKKVTAKLFEQVQYEGAISFIGNDAFTNEYDAELLKNSFSKLYNGYYDNKNPTSFNLSEQAIHVAQHNFDDLFSDEKIDWVYKSIAIKNDIETLENIANKSIEIETFDYDGKRFTNKQASELVKDLTIELDAINELILQNDIHIYQYFLQLENSKGNNQQLQPLYRSFFEYDNAYLPKCDLYHELMNNLQFISVTTPYEQITRNFITILPQENNVKKELQLLLADTSLTEDLNKELINQLNHYCSNKLVYFSDINYHDENLQILYKALHAYADLIAKKYFLLKKAILNYQESLL